MTMKISAQPNLMGARPIHTSRTPPSIRPPASPLPEPTPSTRLDSHLELSTRAEKLTAQPVNESVAEIGQPQAPMAERVVQAEEPIQDALGRQIQKSDNGTLAILEENPPAKAEAAASESPMEKMLRQLASQVDGKPANPPEEEGKKKEEEGPPLVETYQEWTPLVDRGQLVTGRQTIGHLEVWQKVTTTGKGASSGTKITKLHEEDVTTRCTSVSITADILQAGRLTPGEHLRTFDKLGASLDDLQVGGYRRSGDSVADELEQRMSRGEKLPGVTAETLEKLRRPVGSEK